MAKDNINLIQECESNSSIEHKGLKVLVCRGWRTVVFGVLAVALVAISSYLGAVRSSGEAVPWETLLYKSRVRAVVYSLLQSGPSAPAAAPSGDAPDKVISCYYNTPTPYNMEQLLPNNIHPFLCTHINVAFARIVDKQIKLDEHQVEAMKQVVGLKASNPDLKVLLSIGGAGNDNGFSDMVKDHASRKVFIKSVKYTLKNYSLDGIDLDWEFPVYHNRKDGLGKRERQHFSQLLREIRTEYMREKRDYLLTAAVAAPKIIVDVSYDVDQINNYLDFANLMTYDFHSFTKFSPMTGLNSPLYQRPSEDAYMATLNINFTVNMYIEKGLDKSKIVVGIPTYGHTFTLMNADNNKIGSPAAGFGSLGALGFVNYPDVCNFWKDNKCNVNVKHDYDAKVPYLYSNLEWVSFDTPQSVMEKAKFIKDNKLLGAMIYSLNADDYKGLCEGELGGDEKFPLLLSIKNSLK